MGCECGEEREDVVMKAPDECTGMEDIRAEIDLWYLLTLSAWSITSFVVIPPVYCQAVGLSVCMALFIEISRC